MPIPAAAALPGRGARSAKNPDPAEGISGAAVWATYFDRMRFFVDEDLSPALVGPCRDAGYEATCSRDRDMLGMSDREVAALCLDEERVLVSNNAGDFFKLTSASGLHPGLVILPLGSRAQEVEWIRVAISTGHVARSGVTSRPA